MARQRPQLTSEATAISDFDVTSDGGRLAFVANNTLIELDLVDGTRTVKVEGEPITSEDSEDRFNRRIHDLHYSPDDSQIAFGLAGVNLVESGPYTDVFPLLPSSPYPDPSKSSTQSTDDADPLFLAQGVVSGRSQNPGRIRLFHGRRRSGHLRSDAEPTD